MLWRAIIIPPEKYTKGNTEDLEMIIVLYGKLIYNIHWEEKVNKPGFVLEG